MSARMKVTPCILFLCLLCRSGFAQEAGATREAARHFQRGVALYGETDYRAALVEFKRAYALAPNVAVLYNVGEAEFQLQDYAGALTTFERYLSESGASDAHRAEVEGSVEVLRARVGHLTIATSPPGAEVTVDDQSVGRTPLERPVLVSIGHRRVVATIPGRQPSTRYVDVAADDNVTVNMQLAPPADAMTAQASRSTLPARDAEPSAGGSTLRVLGWIGTGMFAAGAVTFAVLAERESNTLQSARTTYPASSATLSHEAGLTTTYSILADSLAGAAVLVGGITVVSAVLSHSAATRPRGEAGSVRVGLGPGSARFEMTF
jgi:hypothetical protein